MLFIFAPENLPFTISIVMMLAIAALEGVTSLFGAGLSHIVDSLIPDTDVDFDVDVDVDVDADFDVDGPDADVDAIETGGGSALTNVLGWLSVGKVPFLVLLVIFLTVFGMTGLALQGAVQTVTGTLLPGWLAAAPALIVTLPAVRIGGRGLAKIIPKDESSAVSRTTFVGRTATITLGTAARGAPAQAKLHDEHGQAHYIMVEPDIAGESFQAGENVLLVARKGGLFRVIRTDSAALSDK